MLMKCGMCVWTKSHVAAAQLVVSMPRRSRKRSRQRMKLTHRLSCCKTIGPFDQHPNKLGTLIQGSIGARFHVALLRPIQLEQQKTLRTI